MVRPSDQLDELTPKAIITSIFLLNSLANMLGLELLELYVIN